MRLRSFMLALSTVALPLFGCSSDEAVPDPVPVDAAADHAPRDATAADAGRKDGASPARDADEPDGQGSS